MRQHADTYLDYVKMCRVEVDRGGLIHVSNDAFQFFCAVEEVTYQMLKKGSIPCKDEVIGKVMSHQTVEFFWDIITDGLNEDWSAGSNCGIYCLKVHVYM